MRSWAANRPRMMAPMVPKMVYQRVTRSVGQKSEAWNTRVKFVNVNTRFVRMLGAVPTMVTSVLDQLPRDE